MGSPYDFVQSETSWWRKVVLPVIIFAGTTLLIVAYINISEQRRKDHLLYTEGVIVQGALDNRYVSRTKNYRRDYKVNYYFYIGNQPYYGSAVVDQRPTKADVLIKYVPR